MLISNAMTGTTFVAGMTKGAALPDSREEAKEVEALFP